MDYLEMSTFIEYPNEKPQPMSGTPGERLEITKHQVENLRSDIKHEIIREYSEVKEEEVDSLYTPLFDRVFSICKPDQYCLTIFTTNYDRAIEVFCEHNHEKYHLVDGTLYDT